MRQFTLTISNSSDIPAVLAESLRNMGSLAASRSDWASLLRAMSVDLHYTYHDDAPERPIDWAAQVIVETAVPAEGDPDPRRADCNVSHKLAQFGTPGGVTVTLNASDAGDEIALTIDFGRESTHLATLILADLFRRVPAAAPLLAVAAAEAAEEYAVLQE